MKKPTYTQNELLRVCTIAERLRDIEDKMKTCAGEGMDELRMEHHATYNTAITLLADDLLGVFNHLTNRDELPTPTAFYAQSEAYVAQLTE